MDNIIRNNSNLFEIEKSTGNADFKKIGTVKAANNGSSPSQYEFTDAHPSDNNFYRLKMIDKDGKYAYSKVVSINFDSQGATVMQLYPNPAQNFIVLELNNNKEENAALCIQNTLGVTVVSTNIQLVKGLNRITLTQVQPVAKGVYLLTVKTAENVFRSKFIKGGG